MARKLRIAVSVLFGVLTLFLAVMWVRSYWREYELVVGVAGLETRVATARGVVGFFAETGSPRLDLYSRVVNENQERYLAECTILGFGIPIKSPAGIFLPTWCLMLCSALISVRSFQNRWTLQFSLRTLLIATTLLAVVLGLAVWAER